MSDDRTMSKAAQKILDEFDALPETDRKIVAVEILERAVELNDLSFAEADEDIPFTDEEWAEIQKRRAEHAQDPASAIPWEEVRTQLYRRFS